MPAETVLPIDPCVDQLSRWSPLLRVDDVTSELLALLEQVPDPRDRRGRRYRLPSLLVLALSAVAAGARSFYAIADWVSCASAEVLAGRDPVPGAERVDDSPHAGVSGR